MPQSADLLKPGLEKDYDVIVMYDMIHDISPGQQKAFVALLNKEIGVVALHHTLGAHPEWPEYEKIIGGKYQIKPRIVNGQPLAGSTFKHDVDLSVKVANTDHPITRGVKPFAADDEWYYHMRFREGMSGVTPILTAMPGPGQRVPGFRH